MKKIKLTTNYGKIFDFVLNAYINIRLRIRGIIDDQEAATKFTKSVVENVKKKLAKHGL